MNPKLFYVVFSTVFLAELGDKTQIATLLYAAERDNSKLVVFAAAALALIVASALGVLVGAKVSSWVSPHLVSRIAGLGFIAIGVWTFARA